jgi:hypothetical protein
VGEEDAKIFALKSAILCVLRAFDFFQQIKRDIQSSQRKQEIPHFGAGFLVLL